ncbi:hypothetical protein SAMN02745227_00762 [Anaerobranca californiensis DSM 14826]|jgi:hypothetical protein|uniref:DUF5668 domain-containing protein n=1 Tax=Anaerobranca californiensis DSM 14826 TaxID=1120989 RepID=A0A1M6MCB0_9FIRM|nr:hypothetical protein [Anaerobranca californiensis]SHJ81010.1 hypothetical protein SAMN02745227_00762 [Anaerobranca californiensis DSM 14826]
MDKEQFLNLMKRFGVYLYKRFFFFKEYCNNYIFSTSLIFIGFGLLLLNFLNLGFYNPFILGLYFIVLHFFYNRYWLFSLSGSLLLTIGLYIILLFSYLLPNGGESAIVLAIGLGFIIFYIIDGRWENYWPLIPGVPLSLFGLLVYLHQTGSYTFTFMTYLYRFWPVLIIIFGVISLFWRKIKGYFNN